MMRERVWLILEGCSMSLGREFARYFLMLTKRDYIGEIGRILLQRE